MDIELYELVFESRKNDNVTKNELGDIIRINNTIQIGNEFLMLEEIIYKISELTNINSDIIYQNMIDSYYKHDILNVSARRNYVLGMSYARMVKEYNEPCFTEEEVGNIINKVWNSFLLISNVACYNKNLIDDYTFLGIDDEIRDYYNFGEDQIQK